jgi:hypothetical protein
MKKIILIQLLSFGTILSMGQTLDCKKLKEGKFKLDNETSGVTLITRTGDIQREENEKYGIITEDKVEWINECSYKLTPYKVIKNDSKIDFSTDMKLEIEIIEIKADSYVQKTTSRLTGQSRTVEIQIIKK